jgi:predicted DCC family thiol-disulfide oxidoreductase YuxK
MTATDTAPTPTAADGKAVVLYDGACPFCRAGIDVLRRLDWRKRFHFQDARRPAEYPKTAAPLVPKRLLEEMHVVTPDRTEAHAGFRAFRWLAWRMPATALIAPLLYVPGVLWAGDKAYKWVAKNRFKLIPCKDGNCAVTPAKG